MLRPACAALAASLAFATAAMSAPGSSPKRSAPMPGSPSHCERDETTVFSCSIGRKVVSLCASDDIGPSNGRVRYAFGRMGKPELLYPAAGTDPRAAFSYGLMAKGDYVRFMVGKVSYVVFSHTQPDVGDVEGVVVTRPGRAPVTLICKDGALGQVGWQPIYKAKLPRDQEGFDGPP
jgi:hypothetical protein